MKYENVDFVAVFIVLAMASFLLYIWIEFIPNHTDVVPATPISSVTMGKCQ